MVKMVGISANSVLILDRPFIVTARFVKNEREKKKKTAAISSMLKEIFLTA